MPWAAVKLVVAVLVLNGLLSHHNLWPTFRPRISAELSLEVAILVLCVALAAPRDGLARPGLRWGLTAAVGLLVLGRYADVTAGGLFGRPLDLYWDLPHLPAVVAMATAGEPIWRIALVCTAVLAAAALLLALIAWSLGALGAGLAHRPTRWLTAAVMAGLLLAYTAGRASDRLRSEWWFAFPVLPVYAGQIVKLVDELSRERTGPAAFTARQSDLRGLGGADVFLLFFESYGATLLETPRHAHSFRPRLAGLSRRLEAAGWHGASALFDSPTFGGASWLAHASVFSGTRIADQGLYQDFLRSGAESLITRFRTAGYRAVALMPGIKRAWPEGAGLGFDRVYSAAGLDYRGADFGWWRIPDQFSLARLFELERRAGAAEPLLVFFPTIMSHMPFQPAPPYLADWSRVTDPAAFPGPPAPAPGGQLDPDQVERSYLRAVDYNLALLEGFLRERAPADALVLVVGDHQPPALVSGREASWRVPTHIISRDRRRLSAFLEAGFRGGLLPGGESLGGLEALNALVLGAFDGTAVSSACAAPREACP